MTIIHNGMAEIEAFIENEKTTLLSDKNVERDKGCSARQ